MYEPLRDLSGAKRKEKKPVKPKMVDVFEGCRCQKKKPLVKTRKKAVERKNKKKKKR